MIRFSIIPYFLLLPCLALADPLYDIDLTVARQGFDGKMCWVHARAGAIPPRAPGNPGLSPLVVMTMQKLDITGSDVFYALNEMRTSDVGTTWSEPLEHESFARVPFSWRESKDLEITVCDFWPRWHPQSGKLIGIGHTVVYENNRVKPVRPRSTAYAVYDPEVHRWSDWQTILLPPFPRFENAGAGCAQRFDLPNGDLLIPFYFKEPEGSHYSTTVMRARFQDGKIHYVEHGSELTVPVKRGLYEPSLTKFGNRFYLTMRNDEHGYISASDDGLHFSEPKPWTFDDGTDLGNYNTQQHWVSHSDALFLVYTRRGANNDHVMRHRAPLFISRVDPENLQVIRVSEQVLVPEHGVRLGNFGVTEVSESETWVTVTEWMQLPGPIEERKQRIGQDREHLTQLEADNRVWVAKLRWNKPNRSFPWR
ncbi:MAG: exo-alpha-sialidase [Verrucomicrobiae bacterium]|nr:exo-alpha-sialidase [Verrucomicrobiae bacterium]